MYAVTAKGMKYMDQFASQAGLPGVVLMENAARGVADEVAERIPDKSAKILVLAGHGNNGGDAVAAARWLAQKGYSGISVYFAGRIEKAGDELKRQMSILVNSHRDVRISGLRGVERSVLNAKYDCIIDGMYGIGLNKILGDDDIRLVKYINSKAGYKVAVDIPSGLNATSGLIMGEAVRADLTVTFGCYKTGMFFGAGRECCGEVKVVDIGLMNDGYDNVNDKLEVLDSAFLDRTVGKALAPRAENGHKGTFGTVGLVISSNGMLGAGMLAAKAAYRAGCGLVKIFCPSKYTGFFNVSIPEAVAVPYKPDDVLGAFEGFRDEVDVLLIGPGLREDSVGRLLVKQILAGKKPVVFDAGALNLIAKNLKSLRKRKCQCVITPHLGEMARLCGEDINIVARSRIGYTRKFSEKFEVSMVVKSDVSLIALRDAGNGQKLYLNTVGNSGLATAGSGDVLAGVIASLIAQGNTLDTSLMYGVMIHGKAAEKFAQDSDSRRKMMAGDIIDNLF
ncbi:MAG: NAD(P)H-hydrate dehydratase [Mogibacterium sp.]|nr:NAD(P)H-hydrate dehydratase [Mogibacterium sp.]MBQ6500399.1 NAD(P)H-hydrate dehydratase [Mogibacterium sp.]